VPGRKTDVAECGARNPAVLDTHAHQVTATVSLGSFGVDPFSVEATANAIYVADQGANALAVIDPRTLKVLTTIRVGNSPYGVWGSRSRP
jgi:YVTN family beta-propeller protein